MIRLGFVRSSLSVLLLLATVIAVYNVYGDNAELVKTAEALACGKAPCVRLLRAKRTPIEQSFTFQTNLSPPRTRDVSCERAFLLVGDFACNMPH
jgi:hypothetical protein